MPENLGDKIVPRSSRSMKPQPLLGLRSQVEREQLLEIRKNNCVEGATFGRKDTANSTVLTQREGWEINALTPFRLLLPSHLLPVPPNGQK